MTLLTALKIASAEHDYSSATVAERCPNTPDVDWAKSANAYLRRIPEAITLPAPPSSLIPGIKLGSLKVTGFGSLRIYKPYTTYCLRNNTYIETDVFADQPLAVTVDWKTCSGNHGKFGIKVYNGDFRVVFASVSGEENKVGVSLVKLLSDTPQDPTLFVEGGSEWLKTATSIANVITLPYLELLWNMVLRRDAHYFIKSNVEI